MDRFDYNQPDTRKRVAARRKSRAARAAAWPGPRRVAGAWFASGRVASLILLIASLGGLVYLFTSPRFAVWNIQVTGAQIVTPREIAELVDVRGRPIWFVDTRQVVERLKTSAYVEQASAALALPDQLTIEVIERRPEMRWQAGGALYLVDASGLVLGPADSAPITGTQVLVIEDRSARLLQPNDRVDPDALELSRMLALRLPAELGMTPARLGWDVGAGVFVTTADGRTIVFGRNERLDEKLTLLKTLIEDGAAFTYLDLRPITPYYRNESGEPSQQTP